MPQLHDNQLQTRVAARMETLSPQLRRAASFVAAHPEEVATRSLRQIAGAAKVAPQTMSRLARALDCGGYEELRELCRAEYTRPVISLSERAGALQARNTGSTQQDTPFILAQSESAVSSIDMLVNGIDIEALRHSVDRLAEARRVVVIGVMGSAAIGKHLDYVAAFAFENWTFPVDSASWSRAMWGLGPEDAAIIVAHAPYARQSVERARFVHSTGAFLIAITDDVASPLIPSSSASFIVPTESPQFFPSYIATLLLIESIMGMLVRRGGPAVRKRVAAAESANASMGDYWQG
ncbi:MAG: MurR/RpiR family transcriptional regulator [Pseudomonadota bacterium]